jgi:tetratricopeptide (TPR) repeat protein
MIALGRNIIKPILVGTLLWFAVPDLLGSAPEFVDPVACRACHSAIYQEYAKTPMGRSFYRPRVDEMIEDWELANPFYHVPSANYYEMRRRADNFYIRRYQIDENGRQTNSLERQVTYIMGSGVRARSYLHRTPEGRIIELPVSWYSQERRWAMAPGYDRPKHPDYSRRLNHKCMFCHNAYPKPPLQNARQGWDHDVHFPDPLPMGIDCQRCHGPGSAHIRAAANGESPDSVRNSVINPRRLGKERKMDVCMQCHLETTTSRLPGSFRRFGRQFYSYIAGEPLGDYIVHFDHAPGTGHDDKFEIVSAAYRLRQAACFQKSELTCTTCHDVHKSLAPEQRASHYRRRCLTCHSLNDSARHQLSEERFNQADCVQCHMPARRTEDVVHVTLTDHLIQRTKPDRDLLGPRQERSDDEQIYRGKVVLYYPEKGLDPVLREILLGIAQVKDQSNLQPGVELLQRALSQVLVKHPEPYFELAEAQVALGRSQEARKNYLQTLELDPAFVQAENNLGNLLVNAGEINAAIKHYRRALQLDPDFAAVHTNLGLALLAQKDLPAAERAFRQAIAVDSMDASAHRDLGATLLLQEKMDAARAALETALALSPSDPKAHNNLGLVLVAQGKQKEGIVHLKYALRHGNESDRESTRQTLQRLGITP